MLQQILLLLMKAMSNVMAMRLCGPQFRLCFQFPNGKTKLYHVIDLNLDNIQEKHP